MSPLEIMLRALCHAVYVNDRHFASSAMTKAQKSSQFGVLGLVEEAQILLEQIDLLRIQEGAGIVSETKLDSVEEASTKTVRGAAADSIVALIAGGERTISQ